jgi:hypothetical protein
MSIVRKTLGALSAAAMLLSATAATASVRPSDSLVSASSVSAVNGVRQNADLKKKNDAAGITWVLIFIVIGTISVAVWVAVDNGDDEPVSP